MITAPSVKSSNDRQSDSGWLVKTDADRQLVVEQLERLLTSPAFRGSKRLSSFLRYIVEQTLENGGKELKERTIGVQVFGRAPDYDTSGEPVVRVSAGDLRKRIAQYYHEPGHEAELRIDLPTGSYHPVFHLAASSTPPLVAEVITAPSIPAEVRLSPIRPVEPPVRKEPSRQWMAAPRVMYGAITALAIGVAVFALIASRPGNAYEQFWGPVVSEAGSVLIYLGHTPPDGHIVKEDAIALTDLIGDLRAKGKPYRILEADDMTPELMKQGPSLMIGGFTNPVTQRLTSQARFTFVREGTNPSTYTHYILDKQNPGSRAWLAPSISGPTPTFTDYAIVSRILDPATDRLAVVSAGIHRYATLAAADFLSNPEKIGMLTANAPRDWRKKDMQAVLAMDVKDGKAGPIRVLASYFW